ncbi:hypothetical protein [Vibrio parahaemolyticus]|uniref:hypothetical protein n=1 Tax=Vibrio parahaemolyticus TaxID=670 RepID=UPI003D814C96
MSTDVFVVDLPWCIPNQGPFKIQEFEVELVKFQQFMIEDLQRKLERLNGAATEELQQKYQELESKFLALQADRDRQFAAVETMRNMRNKSDERANSAEQEKVALQDKLTALTAEHNKTKTDLKHAQNELAGVPKLIENKVKAALSNHTVSTVELDQLEQGKNDLEAKLKESSGKNRELSDTVGKLTKKANESEAHIELLSELVATQTGQIESMQEGMRNADRNYHSVMHHLDELIGYSAIVSGENVTLRNDALYLEQIRELHNMKQVWGEAGWQAFFLARSGMLDLAEGMPAPDTNFGILFLVNTETGCGHTAYFDKQGDVCFSADVHESVRLPEHLWESFKTGAKQLPIKEMEQSVLNATERARKLVAYANVLDIQWNTTASLAEICRRLNDYVPEHELMRALTNIERAKALAPKSQSLIERINKRFDTAYKLRTSNTNAKPKVGKPKRDRKKRK